MSQDEPKVAPLRADAGNEKRESRRSTTQVREGVASRGASDETNSPGQRLRTRSGVPRDTQVELLLRRFWGGGDAQLL